MDVALTYNLSDSLCKALFNVILGITYDITRKATSVAAAKLNMNL